MELIFIPLAIIALLIFTSQMNNLKIHTRLIQILYIINSLCLLSSCFIHYNERLPQGAGLENGSLRWLYEILFWPFVFNQILRFIFIPYIYFAILTGFYIKDLKINHFPKKGTILFILLLLLSICGLVFLEIQFQDFLKHLGSV